MRISVGYIYAIFKYGYPHSVDDAFRAIEDVRELGFHYMEMEGLGRENLHAVYGRRQELADRLAKFGLHVHNFCVVDPEMVSTDADQRRRALEGFHLGAEIADLLECETLHLASYAPPVEYLKRPPYQLDTGAPYEFENTTALRLPLRFDWERVWAALVESCQFCADVAAEHGRTVIMEPRIGEVICSVDSLLRLMEHVDRPNFKANFDTAHFSAQRENVVLALAKLKGHFANVHVSDNDPSNSQHVPIGEGTIDWPEFLRTLHAMGYNGYLGVDLGLTDRLVEGYERSRERLLALGQQLNIPMEV